MSAGNAVVKNPPQNAAGKYQISDHVLGCGAWSVVKRCFPIAPYVPPRGPGAKARLEKEAAQQDGTSKSAAETNGDENGEENGLNSTQTGASAAAGGDEINYVVKIIEKEYLLSLTHGDVERATAEVKREIDVLRHVPPHMNVVEFIEHFETDKHFLLIFEEVAGGDLCELILSSEGNKLSEPQAKVFALQTILAVLHCHLNDVVHRDIKPENLLVSKNQETGEIGIKLTDFGLAKRLKAAPSGSTSPTKSSESPSAATTTNEWTKHPLHSILSTKKIECSEIIGTPRYGAPEMFHGHLNKIKYDGYSADTWSVGVVVYITLTGSFPFSAGADATEKQMLDVINRTQLVLPKTISSEAAEFLRGLLCKDVGKRLKLWEALDHPWLAGAVADAKKNAQNSDAMDAVVTNDGKNLRALNVFQQWEKTSDASQQRAVMDAMAKELKELHEVLQTQRVKALRHRLGQIDGAPPTSTTTTTRTAPGRGISPGPGGSTMRRPIASPAPSPARVASPVRATGHTATTTTTGNRTATPPRRATTPVASKPVGAHRDPNTTTTAARTGPASRGTSPTPSTRPASGTTTAATRVANSPLHRASASGVRRGTPLRPTTQTTTTTRTAAATSGAATKPSVRVGVTTPTARSGTPTARTGTPSARSGTPTRTTPSRVGVSTTAGTTRTGVSTRSGTPTRTTPLPSRTTPGRTTAGAATAAMSSPGGPAPGADFTVGDNVVYKGNKAVVRFHGTTTFGPGVWMGLEMLEGNEGTNDGTSYLDKKKYFTCPKGKGVFVRASQVKK